jgi:hypothetical protein
MKKVCLRSLDIGAHSFKKKFDFLTYSAKKQENYKCI